MDACEAVINDADIQASVPQLSAALLCNIMVRICCLPGTGIAVVHPQWCSFGGQRDSGLRKEKQTQLGSVLKQYVPALPVPLPSSFSAWAPHCMNVLCPVGCGV